MRHQISTDFSKKRLLLESTFNPIITIQTPNQHVQKAHFKWYLYLRSCKYQQSTHNYKQSQKDMFRQIYNTKLYHRFMKTVELWMIFMGFFFKQRLNLTYTIPKIYTYWFRVFFVGIGMVECFRSIPWSSISDRYPCNNDWRIFWNHFIFICVCFFCDGIDYL